jgi:predicted RNase H-like nuclease (RuvC/YqgF family)
MAIEESYVPRYTLMLTVIVATLTAVLSAYFVFQKEASSNSTAFALERIDVTARRLEQLTEYAAQIQSLQAENKKLSEQLDFYKQKNEFLTAKLAEVEKKK